MNLGSEVRVGTVTLLGILMAVTIVFFLRGKEPFVQGNEVAIRFDDAQGLERGSAVRMAGVKIGEVARVDLEGNKAVVKVRLLRERNIPWGSCNIQIRKGGLIGEYYISVMPARAREGTVRKPAQALEGSTQPQLEDLIPQASALMDDLRRVSRNVDIMSENVARLSGDPSVQGALRQAIFDMQASAAAIRSVVADPQVVGAIRSSSLNVQMATAHGVTAAKNVAAATRELDAAVRIVKNLEIVTTENRSRFNEIMKSLESVAKNVDTASEFLTWFAEESGSKENLQQAMKSLATAATNIEQVTDEARKLAADETLRRDIKESLGELRATMANLKETSAGLQQLLTDQELQTNLKETVRNARETMETAKATMENAKSVTGKVDKVVDKMSKPVGSLFNMRVQPEVSSRYLTSTNRTFTDFSLRMERPSKNLFSLGIHDLGENEKWTLQGGVLQAPLTYRFGLYRSSVGVGLDFRLGSLGQLALDAYDPNDPHVNVWGDFRLKGPLRLMLGLEDAMDDRMGGWGLRYQW